MSTDTTGDLNSLTADVVSAYLGQNKVAAGELATLIEATYAALANLGTPPKPAEPEFVPAVSVRKSLASPDWIISMIDGRSYVTLKKHLATNGLTPDEYRARYNLPADYPMVASAYSARRSEMAKAIGLGASRWRAAPPAPAPAPEPKPKPPRRKLRVAIEDGTIPESSSQRRAGNTEAGDTVPAVVQQGGNRLAQRR